MPTASLPALTTKRIRNRSLCSIALYTPPSYPGYKSIKDSTTARLMAHQRPIFNIKSPDDDEDDDDDVINSTQRTIKQHAAIKPMISTTSSAMLRDRRSTDNSKEASSGYASCCSSESDPDIVDDGQQRSSVGAAVVVMRRVARCDQQAPVIRRNADKLRRKSVPAYMRHAFSDEIIRVLKKDGLVHESDDDEAVQQNADINTSQLLAVNRPETVLQLARMFSEASALHDAEQHRQRCRQQQQQQQQQLESRSGPSTPVRPPTADWWSTSTTYTGAQSHQHQRLGGIASLSTSQMSSKTNIFKQMDAIASANRGTNNTGIVNKSSMPRSPSSIKDALLRWCQLKTKDYPVQISNFSSSWADGMAFCALLHRFCPNAFDFSRLDPRNRKHNLELAFRVGEEYGVAALLEVDDMLMMGDKPDWKCVFTYVQTIYKQFRDQ